MYGILSSISGITVNCNYVIYDLDLRNFIKKDSYLIPLPNNYMLHQIFKLDNNQNYICKFRDLYNYDYFLLNKINLDLDLDISNTNRVLNNLPITSNWLHKGLNNKFLTINSQAYLQPNKKYNKLYSETVYANPTTGNYNVDIQPYMKDVLNTSYDFYDTRYNLISDKVSIPVYYELSGYTNGIVNISHIQFNKTNNYKTNYFEKMNGEYIPNKPLNKFIQYSASSAVTDRIFNTVLFDHNFSLEYTDYNHYYTITVQPYIRDIINSYCNVYSYFNNKTDNLNIVYSGITSFEISDVFSLLTPLKYNVNDDEFNTLFYPSSYNQEKYGAIEYVLDGVSYWYFFEFICDKNDEKVMLFWLNKNYAYDYIPMNKKLVKSIKTQRNSFETNNYFPITNYMNESEMYLDLNSDLLKDKDYKLLQDIIDSTSVFIVYTDDFGNVMNKQVLLDQDTFVFKKYKNDEMFNFSVRVKFADKNTTY